MQTIKIAQDTELGYRIIYLEDFNPETDVEYEVKVTLDDEPKPTTRKSKKSVVES